MMLDLPLRDAILCIAALKAQSEALTSPRASALARMHRRAAADISQQIERHLADAILGRSER